MRHCFQTVQIIIITLKSTKFLHQLSATNVIKFEQHTQKKFTKSSRRSIKSHGYPSGEYCICPHFNTEPLVILLLGEDNTCWMARDRIDLLLNGWYCRMQDWFKSYSLLTDIETDLTRIMLRKGNMTYILRELSGNLHQIRARRLMPWS